MCPGLQAAVECILENKEEFKAAAEAEARADAEAAAVAQAEAAAASSSSEQLSSGLEEEEDERSKEDADSDAEVLLQRLQRAKEPAAARARSGAAPASAKSGAAAAAKAASIRGRAVTQARTRKAPVLASAGNSGGAGGPGLPREVLELFGSVPSELMGAGGPRQRAKRPLYAETGDDAPFLQRCALVLLPLASIASHCMCSHACTLLSVSWLYRLWTDAVCVHHAGLQ